MRNIATFILRYQEKLYDKYGMAFSIVLIGISSDVILIMKPDANVKSIRCCQCTVQGTKELVSTNFEFWVSDISYSQL